ncbi:retrovirus-related pol polyprotein from transposon TNT 1-94 [Tanacetum coccineum]
MDMKRILNGFIDGGGLCAQTDGFVDLGSIRKSLPSKESSIWIKTSSESLLFQCRSCRLPDTPKSTSGGIQFLGDKLVSWMSKKHDCTAMSSAEAEYVALSASSLSEDRFQYLVRRIGMRCLTPAELENRGPLHALSDHIVIADHEDDIMGIVMQCTTLSQHSEDELTRLIEKIVTIWFTLTVLSALRHSGNENKQEWLNLILCVRDPSFELEPCRDSLNLLITVKVIKGYRQKVFTEIGYSWKPTGRIFTIIGNSFPLTGITSTKEVPLKETTITPVITPYSKLKVVQIVLWNDHIAKIIGYGDYQMGNVTISRVYYVEDGVDLIKGSRGSNLYTLSLDNLLLSSPICLLSKASKTKSWLWHQRLSHLNIDLSLFAKQGSSEISGLIAPGPERQQAAAAGSPGAAEDALIVDEGAQAVPAPVQAPQPPPPVPQHRTMRQRIDRLEQEMREL